MSGIFKLSEPALLALHAMAYLARHKGETVAVRKVAEIYSASGHHLAKVLRELSRKKLVVVVRGPRGGFKLAKPPSKITLMHVYEAIEGRYDPTVCFAKAKKCPLGVCILGGQIARLATELKQYLNKTTLAMVAKESDRILGKSKKL